MEIHHEEAVGADDHLEGRGVDRVETLWHNQSERVIRQAAIVHQVIVTRRPAPVVPLLIFDVVGCPFRPVCFFIFS